MNYDCISSFPSYVVVSGHVTENRGPRLVSALSSQQTSAHEYAGMLNTRSSDRMRPDVHNLPSEYRVLQQNGLSS